MSFSEESDADFHCLERPVSNSFDIGLFFVFKDFIARKYLV